MMKPHYMEVPLYIMHVLTQGCQLGSLTLVKPKYEQLSLYCLVAEKLGNNMAYRHMSALSENNLKIHVMLSLALNVYVVVNFLSQVIFLFLLFKHH